jgi:hypothetical protein
MAGSITKQFDFIINSATHAVSKKRDLKLPRSTSFNYFVAESISTMSIGWAYDRCNRNTDASALFFRC